MSEALLAQKGLEPLANPGWSPTRCSAPEPADSLAGRSCLGSAGTEWKQHPKGTRSNICWAKQPQTSPYPWEPLLARQGPACDTRHKPMGALRARDTHQCHLPAAFSPLKASVAQFTPQNTLATVTNAFLRARNAELKQVRGEEAHLFQDSSYGRVKQSKCRHGLSFPRLWEKNTELLIAATGSLNWFFSISAINSH